MVERFFGVSLLFDYGLVTIDDVDARSLRLVCRETSAAEIKDFKFFVVGRLGTYAGIVGVREDNGDGGGLAVVCCAQGRDEIAIVLGRLE